MANETRIRTGPERSCFFQGLHTQSHHTGSTELSAQERKAPFSEDRGQTRGELIALRMINLQLVALTAPLGEAAAVLHAVLDARATESQCTLETVTELVCALDVATQCLTFALQWTAI